MSLALALGYVGLALLGFVLSALYSGLETGLYTLNRVRLTVRAAQGFPPAVRLRRHLHSPQRVLTVLLIGTNAANYLGTFAAANLLGGFGLPDWELIVVNAAVMTPLLFVFAEVLPKDLFRTHTDRWTYRLGGFITASRALFTWTGLVPVIELMTSVVNRSLEAQGQHAVTARQRISQLFKEGAGAGVLSSGQVTLTDRALAMRDHVVGRVMVPWRHVATLPIDADAGARVNVLRAHRFTRLPVVERGRVTGVVSWSDALLAPDTATRDLVQPAPAFSARTKLLDALSTMRAERRSLAIVEDAAGRPLGIVTLKDLVEPLTGELGAW